MPVEVQDHGRYELFETTKGHRILALSHRRWFAWVEGQQGEILVHSDADHREDHTIQEGRFFLVDFRDDPQWKDMPHLFLQKDNSYQVVVVPEGLPTEDNYQKKIVMTDEVLPRDDLERYIRHPAPAGPGEERMGRPGGGSMANVTHYLRDIDFPAMKSQVIEHARKQHAPNAVIEQLEKVADRRYVNMADLMGAMGGKGEESSLPITGYEGLAVDEVLDRLDGLTQEELQHVDSYERGHKNRKTVHEQITRRLKRAA
jgi:hypothetical protein